MQVKLSRTIRNTQFLLTQWVAGAYIEVCGKCTLIRIRDQPPLPHHVPVCSIKRMSDYSGFGSSYGSRGAAGAPDKGKIMEQVRNQVALASAQELIQVNIISDRATGEVYLAEGKSIVFCVHSHVFR